MKKKLIIITATIVALATLIISLLLFNRELELPRLTADDISNIYYHDTDKNETVDLDIEEFLGYYNQIYDLRDNKEGAGSTPSSWIKIELKDGQEIGIYNTGKQFQVSFTDNDGERHQYWGRQQEIYNMLYKGFYKLK